MPQVMLSADRTLYKQRTKRYVAFIREYELIKCGRHPEFTQVQAWTKARRVDKRNFLKYYNRYKQSGGDVTLLLPQKRGPKYRTRRADLHLEEQVRELGERGSNRYEIADVLKKKHPQKALSPSGVYKVLCRLGLNRLRQSQRQEKRKIIKERMGELGHIDTYYLSKYIITGEVSKLYVVAVMDDYSRLTWAEVIEGIDSLSVMFGAMRCFMMLKSSYSIQFEEVLSDNGSEFGNRSVKNKAKHPFERLLSEMGIRHRNTQPYRPQTNGKIERFWKTLYEDLLEDTDFGSLDELKEELFHYLAYYNHERHHQAINCKPIKMLNKTTL
ncbi:MAG TPA: integrase core domain-containing protein [Flavisolibacter sp.]|nr:integrase core domain-containing protein [Flavisolibacter sp.]